MELTVSPLLLRSHIAGVYVLCSYYIQKQTQTCIYCVFTLGFDVRLMRKCLRICTRLYSFLLSYKRRTMVAEWFALSFFTSLVDLAEADFRQDKNSGVTEFYFLESFKTRPLLSGCRNCAFLDPCRDSRDPLHEPSTLKSSNIRHVDVNNEISRFCHFSDCFAHRESWRAPIYLDDLAVIICM